ncbi:MAG: bifunctional folylpolyglutamate synthase/dihydrofolate synthase [Clostridia bacterium]|nr:bifunctional folylpolyglutamate synthase/dihydrofolate synthase [Clostridia bacterium]
MLEKLLLYLDNPQKNLWIVHIAGTNGKGSTAAMLAEILTHAGYRCGLYTSPYIERFNERIRVNGGEIPDNELARIITRLKDTIERYDAPVSEFALDTAAAFCWFREQKCDVVVLETGLGGRLDATNVITKPLATVLTAIGMDHMQYLGDTLEKITAEKCGILKENCPAVSYPLQEEAVFDVIKNHAREKNAPLFVAEIPKWREGRMEYRGKTYSLGLEGEFQSYNAATVLESVAVLRKQGIEISETAVVSGLIAAKNMARFERFGSNIILDGGHNVPAAKALVQSLQKLDCPVYFCIAMMEDKDYEGYLRELVPIAKGAVVTQVSMPRCASVEKLTKILEKYQIPTETEHNPFAAIEKAKVMAGSHGCVCICGSLYLAGQVRPYLSEMQNDGQC